MHPLAFDTETALIRPAQLAPPMVCLTWQRPGIAPGIEHVYDAKPRLRSWLNDATTLLIGQNVAYDMAVICAEFPELVPLVFAAYRANRVTCTKLRQQLLDIAGGVFRGRIGSKGKWITHKYDLQDLAKRHLGRELIKDGWRLEYANFRDVPLAKWPARAAELQARARVRRAELPAIVDKDALEYNEVRNLDAIIADVPEGVLKYPLDDAECTLGVYLSQEKHAAYLKDQYRQAYAQFVLYLSSTWGLRTHGPGVEALRVELTQAHDELELELQALSLVRDNGTRDMKAIKARMIEACHVYGLPLRRTDAHEKCELGDACDEHISLDADACDAVVQAAASGEGDAAADAEAGEAFMTYAEFTAVTKMLTNDVKMLVAGTVYPVHTRYDMAETGRTTSSKPNIQNMNTGRMKRGQETRVSMRLRPGIRQAFVPRPGFVFIQADFPQLELYTLAQCCIKWLGFSKLGDMLNAGLDPHLAFAATLLGISYEAAAKQKKTPEVDQARQIGKVFNFGKPGGMGNKKLKVWARKTYGVELTPAQLEQYTLAWHEKLPEMRQYFARVNSMFGDNERTSIETLFTERYRGGATYCAACNNGFQALGVDCAKRAMCLVAEAEYVASYVGGTGSVSPLFGTRTVAMVHDEFIAETPETRDGWAEHHAAFELARLMTVGANEYLPDVPIPMSKMEPTIMRAWSKEAKQLWAGEGASRRLIAWSPE